MSLKQEIILDGKSVPVLALRGLSVFPEAMINFDVERSASIKALDKAMNEDRVIFLVAQKDITMDEPKENDIYKIGTVCVLKQTLRQPGTKIVRVIAEGVMRAKIVEIDESGECMFAELCELPDVEEKLSLKSETYVRKIKAMFAEFSNLTGSMSPKTILNVIAMEDVSKLSNYIAQNIYLVPQDKQDLLEETKPSKRLLELHDILAHELKLAQMQKELSDSTNDQVNQNQKEYFLREQMKVIQAELGDGAASVSDDVAEYREMIFDLGLDAEIEKKLLKEVNNLSRQHFSSSESTVIRNYLDACLSIPWNLRTFESVDLVKAKKTLDSEHFGLDKVKNRIIEYLAVRKLTPEAKGGVICLVGPPGTGKTSIAMSLAKAMNRKLCRVALGGVHDEAEIRGHRKTYVGAMPGRIASGIIQAGSMNPVMVLDEIDKLGSDHRGDPASALLEALDGEQNSKFRDNYLEIPLDLSDVLFITTANRLDTIPRALLDRMEVIELTSYTDEEKVQIAKKYLLPRQRKKHGLTAGNLKMSDDVIRAIISRYTKESGVRNLERELAKVCRKCALGIASEEYKSLTVRTNSLEKLLGAERYKTPMLWAKNEVGLVHGLAWTSVGGEVLDVEVAVIEGSGKLQLTGNLGNVMKESANAALSYIRSRAEGLGIAADFHKTKDIHIHFPEGAVPKDGPSAGMAICVALISALSGVPVRGDVAMTGEISLRGRILAIGGLREKTMAAMRNGITTVIIPSANEHDLDEIDQTVRCALKFVLADHVDNIIDIALFKPSEDSIKAVDMKADKIVAKKNKSEGIRIGQ